MRTRRRALALLTILALPAIASAWHDGGHATIALIAYRSLAPDQRAKLDEILSHHPRYQQDLLAGCPDGANKAEYAFCRAAIWPDTVRERSNPMFAAYHHPAWHYTDVPYFADGDDKTYAYKALGPTKPGEPYDAVSAWKYSLARLNDPTVPASERAVSLCWVLHLGGDIHQPCHCVSLFNAAMPAGDKGANNYFYDTGHDRPDNLHFIWDAFLGDHLSHDQVTAQTDAIEKVHPRSAFQESLKITSIDDWVQEGRVLAISNVYDHGHFTAATKADIDAGKPAPPLPDAYRKNGIELSKKQAALAGYRTGDALAALALPPSTPTTRP